MLMKEEKCPKEDERKLLLLNKVKEREREKKRERERNGHLFEKILYMHSMPNSGCVLKYDF